MPPSAPRREAGERAALDLLRGLGRVVVALSGGVDSAALLALAVEALGRDNVLAATAVSASLPTWELEDARAVARALGVRHAIVETRELQREDYRANRGDRCFHCRSELFERLAELAQREGYAAVAYGAIRDDLLDFRPGMKAARSLGAVAPLLEAGLTKEDVREIARRRGLPVSDKPAAACLASRIPVGTPVTPERLARIARAEAALRELGLRQLRVRDHGDVARVELDAEGLGRLADPTFRRELASAVRDAGFRFAAVDLEGYRPGSLNNPPEAPRTPE